MKKQLTRVSPLRAGIVLGATYALLGLILVPFFLLASAFGKTQTSFPMAGPVLAIFFLVFYAIFGFIVGVIGAAVYNLVAKITGGLEFEVEDVMPGFGG
jgi:hypothetical protein